MKLVQGAPYYLNQQGVFVTGSGDNGATIDESAREVMVTFPGLTLKLPATPQEGWSVRIVALKAVNLDGNGHPISGGGASVPKGTALDLTFYAGVWTPSGNGQALDVKANCRLLATANVALTGLPIIDGVQTVNGDRILLTGQADPIKNSIWIAHAGAWDRAADMAAGSSAEDVFTFISEGTLHADTGWLCTTDRPNDVVGTDPLTWTQFSTFPLAVLPPVNVSRSPALVGASNTAARQDHKHDVVTAAPTAQVIGAGSTGTGPGIALADHVHPAVSGVPLDVGYVSLQGVSPNFSRVDHVHANGPFVGEIIVADRAAVTALPTAGIPVNTYARPRSIDQPFELVPATQVGSINGFDILGSDAVGLVWARRLLPVPRWTAQLNWFVDPTSVNYDADGSAGSPVPSIAEVCRRLRVISVANYSITMQSADPASDTFDFCPQFDNSGIGAALNNATIEIVGQETIVATGTVAAASVGVTTFGTDPNTVGGGQQTQLDAGAAFVWTVGQMVVLTSGVLLGYTAQVLKVISPGVARLSNWWNPGPIGSAGAPFNNGTFAFIGDATTPLASAGTPANGDTFKVVNWTAMNGTYRHAGNPIRLQPYYRNVQFTGTAIFIDEGSDVRVANSQVLCNLSAAQGRGPAFNAALRFFGCFVQAANGRIIEFDARLRFVGCGIVNTTVNAQNTGRTEFYNTVFQTGLADGVVRVGRGFAGFTGDTSETGGQIALFGVASTGGQFAPGGVFGLGVYDAFGSALFAARGGLVSLDAPFYGSGNSVGIALPDEGAHIFYRTGFLRIAAATEILLSSVGAPTAWVGLAAGTAIPSLLAGAAVPAAAPLTTLVQLQGGAFGGYVMSYTSGASIGLAANPD